MKKFQKMGRIVFIVALLLTATLFLLEIPRLYYKKWDEKLLQENGTSKYETQVIKSMDAFIQKVDAFRDYNETSAIGYIRMFTEQEMQKEKEMLVRELNELSGGSYKFLLEQMQDKNTEGSVLEAQIIRFPKRGSKEAEFSDSSVEEQYIWNIRFLELELKNVDGSMLILYDTDSYKIFSLEWSLFGEADAIFADAIDEESLVNYYDGIDLKEPALVQEYEYGMVSVFTLEEVGNSELVGAMYDLTEYYRKEAGIGTQTFSEE